MVFPPYAGLVPRHNEKRPWLVRGGGSIGLSHALPYRGNPLYSPNRANSASY